MSNRLGNRSVVGKIINLLARILLYLWCAFSLFMLVWLLISSLKTDRELFKNPWSLFDIAQIENYSGVWQKNSFSQYFSNSFFVVSLACVFVTVLSAPAAYALAKTKFRFQKGLNYYFILGMGIPVQLLIIPLYSMLSQVGLVDNRWGLIAVYTAISIPFTIFLQSGYFATLPAVLGEAALIDGASPFQVFSRVMLPLGRSGIITSLIFNFISLWNEFMIALVFTSSSSNYTLPVGIYALNTAMTYTGKWTMLLAGLVIALIPTLIIYLLLSKNIIEGLTMGAVKE